MAALLACKNPKLKPLTGKSLAEVAKMRGVSPEDAAVDLVIEDGSRVGVAYFMMSEDNIRREVALPHITCRGQNGAKKEGHFCEEIQSESRARQLRAGESKVRIEATDL